MLIGGILLGLVAGLLAGGSIANLASIRLRWVALLLVAVIIRFLTELGLQAQVDTVQAFRLPLFGLAFGVLLVGLWVNRSHAGLTLAFIGILLNTIAILANGGYMPIWKLSFDAAGFDPNATFGLFSFHRMLDNPTLNADFLLRAGPLGDILPIPIPVIRNVASIGDVFLSAGLGFFLFASVLRSPAEAVAEEEAASGRELTEMAATSVLGRPIRATDLGKRVRPATGLASGFGDASVLDRPALLGGSGAGLSPGTARAPGRITTPVDEVAVRIRRHPFVRLALNSSFSALWVGQLISLFGDRIHQIALAFLVFALTNSPVAVAFVFVFASLPNLFLSPIAGTFVDRWDQKDVMVVSDLLRAAIILVIPIAAVTNILLVYPLIFGVTSVSIFFRPARIAALPRIVREDELLTANSAMWVGETIADVVGYPLAAVFVGFLGPSLPLAFWVDAATYAASAVLIASIYVTPLRDAATLSGERLSVLADMKAGYRFLRGETVLLANTLQAAVAQLTIGVLTALTPLYATGIVAGTAVDAKAAYGFLEAGIGVGNLIGGFVIGVIGTHLARGKTVIAGYAMWGACVALLALTGNLGIAIGLMFGSGIANMVFVIPSQTMIQERTPPEMLGRVLGFRFALVFGSMTIAMALGGLLAQVAGAGPVIGLFGVMTMLVGLAGLLVPAVRDA